MEYTNEELIKTAEAEAVRYDRAAETWQKDNPKAAAEHRDAANKYRAIAQRLRETEWVSVEDGLPEKRIRVTGWDGLIVDDFYIDLDGVWRYSHGSEKVMDMVTHWMPLPPPPTKQAEEG